jgi:hypothetical protein
VRKRFVPYGDAARACSSATYSADERDPAQSSSLWGNTVATYSEIGIVARRIAMTLGGRAERGLVGAVS